MNDDILKAMDRRHTAADVVRAIKDVRQVGGLIINTDLIAGLPYEDLESFKKSFDDVYRLYPEQLQLGFLKVLKGSYMEEMKNSYGLVYKSKPPYEVLYTNWISYDELLVLKMVEEMVEVYYNSGQFTYTLRQLEKEFNSPFQLYLELGKYYENHELHLMSHSRIARYEILLGFVKQVALEKEQLYKELLTFDLYLRENAKNRPAFAGGHSVSKELLNQFFEEEAESHAYLKGYERFDKRQLRKMTHIEKFSFDVAGNCEQKVNYILFDYENRSKLTHQASTFQIF